MATKLNCGNGICRCSCTVQGKFNITAVYDSKELKIFGVKGVLLPISIKTTLKKQPPIDLL